MNAEESQNCCALHFSSQRSPKSSPEVQAGTRVTFWECAKLSCTCELNYLYDDLTVALCGCSFPRADKSVGGGKLVLAGLTWDAAVESLMTTSTWECLAHLRQL